MRRFPTTLLALLLLVVASPARAFVPQTINVDGVNDFDPANLLNDDRFDTQQGCAPPVGIYPMDLGRVYMTNDANYLYIGIEFAQTCYCNMNLGMAFDVGTAGGGTTDPFGRMVGWANVPFKPDYIIYDVTPTSCNTFNYEILYKDTLSTWQNRSQLINPSWVSGANGLGIIDSLNFKELKIPLSALGVSTGTNMHMEFWVTQEGNTHGPLDALFSDDVQMSHPNTTTYDTTAVRQMSTMGLYVVQNSVDLAPPTISSAVGTGFTVLPSKQFTLVSNKIDVQFSEPVDPTTSQVAGNYIYSGPVARNVISAIRDNVASSIVHLTLNAAVSANAAAHVITVSGVKDVAGNTITSNGTTNVGAYFIQNAVFTGDFRLGLCNGNFGVADTFAVEGSLAPLTFTVCDNAVMTDANADSIYTVTVPFCLPRDPNSLKGEANLDWKFTNKCSTYEPLASNRFLHLSSDSGATATIRAAWNNDDPANFTSHAIDVVFRVNATHFNPIGTDVITLLGNTNPLHFTQPGLTMKDDGVAPDAVAGDKIYTLKVTFPSCSPKSVEWKVDYNGTIECLGQSNRALTLDDQLYSQAVPLVLPPRGIDRCSVTDKAVTVVFKVNMAGVNPLPGPADTVVVKGDGTYLNWGWPPNPGAIMADDGLGYDIKAHDGWFTKAVVLPDSTPTPLGFKYDFKMAGWTTDSLECSGYGNRSLKLDDQVYSTSNPIIRLLNVFNYCTDPAAVLPDFPTPKGASFGALRPVMPNPVARHAAFAFELFRGGHVTFTVYDVTGRRVARLLDGTLPAGVHTTSWNGVNDSGLRLASGVYLYELAMGSDRLSRRMILVH